MAKKIINVGQSVNDKSGDPLRSAFQKVNDNFTELYNSLVSSGASVTVGDAPPDTQASGSLWWDSGDGNLYIRYDDAWVQTSPSNNGSTVDIGNIGFVDDTIYNINGINLANSDLTHGPTARILVPENGETAIPLTLQNNYGAVTVIAGRSPDYYWTFGDDGSLTLPNNLKITNSGETAIIGSGSLSTQVVEDIGSTTTTTTVGESQVEIDPTAVVIRRRTTQTRDDGVTTTVDENGGILTIGNGGVSLKQYADPDGPNNEAYAQFRTQGSSAILESVVVDVGGTISSFVGVGGGGVEIHADDGINSNSFSFDSRGVLTLSNNSYLEPTSINLAIGALGSVVIGSHAEFPTAMRLWEFDSLGTLNSPSMLPTTFTATVDAAHYADGSLTLTGDAWHFEVTFNVNPDGTVETQIVNNTPWPSNPGYTNNMRFEFTEADHGIPGYLFTLTLVNIQTPGPSMVTTNLTASIPPSLPSTINNGGTAKLTAGGNDWIFGSDSSTRLPAGALNLTNGDDRTGTNSYNQIALSYSGTTNYPHYIRTRHDDSETANNAIDFWISDGTVNSAGAQRTLSVQKNGVVVGNIEIQGGLKDVEGTTGSTGQVLTRATNGGVKWADATGGAISSSGGRFSTSFDTNANAGIFSMSGTTTLQATYGINLETGYSAPVTIDTGSSQWVFADAGSLTLPGTLVLKATDSFNAIQFSDNGTNDSANIKVDGGYNMAIRAASNIYLARAGQNRIAITDHNSDFMASDAVTIQSNKAVSEGTHTWTFGADSSLTMPGGVSFSGGQAIQLSGGDSITLASATGGTVSVISNSNVWTFGGTGNLTIPGDVLSNNPAGINVTADSTELVALHNAYLEAEIIWSDFRNTDQIDVGGENIRPWVGMNAIDAYPVLTGSWPVDPPAPTNFPQLLSNTLTQYNNWQAALAAVQVSVNVVDKAWQFGSDGALSIPGNIAIQQSQAQVVQDAEALYNSAITDWNAFISADINVTINLGIVTAEGWPFALWQPTGANVASYIAIVDDAWARQISSDQPPPTLLFTPAISASLRNQIRSTLINIQTRYTTWQALLVGSVDITAGNNTLTMLGNGSLTVPGTIYGNGSSLTLSTGNLAPGSHIDLNGGAVTVNAYGKNFKFGYDGKLTLPQTTVPSGSQGAEGDKQGMVAFSASHIYYCTADYVDGLSDIWVRMVWTESNW